MKIGITCYPTFGGSGVVATEIGLAMAERGYEVHFISHSVPSRLEKLVKGVYLHEVEIPSYPLFPQPLYGLALASKMVDVIQNYSLDILHVHYAVPHATSGYLAKQILNNSSIKLITSLHGTDITLVGSDPSYLPITRFSIEQSDFITAPSRFLKNATYDKLRVSRSTEISVIPNFVDTNEYRPATNEEKRKLRMQLFNCCEDETILVHVSNFRPVKRVADVIKVFNKVCKRHRSRLLMIGDGPDRRKAENLAKQLNIREYVGFLGKQYPISDFLRCCDIFILTSENESFGLAALEAMSCGLPIIATRVEGVPEVVKDGVNGYLSEPQNIEKMASDVSKLIEQKDLYEKFAKESRRIAVEQFNKDKIINERYIPLYKKATESTGAHEKRS